jgi:DNA-binding NtrC family response regulator
MALTHAIPVDVATATRVDDSVFVIHVRTGTIEREHKLRLGEQCVIGSASDANLHINDETVSRHHARLHHIGTGVRVADLGSTNGISLGETRVHDITVVAGTSLRMGQAVVSIRHDEQHMHTPPRRAGFGDLIGADARTQQLFGLLQEVSVTDTTVVLEGETGTGKEVVAQAIHHASARHAAPFVVFDCGAVPKDLIESQLFGHVKGAFTGAATDRQGAFRRAHGGTLFLDEIGELPLELQPRLLRALESKTVQPVGSDDHHRVNVRIICASHRSLREEVKRGRFREDLYFRLAVVKVRIPALRERPGDLKVLAEHFTSLWAKGRGTPAPVLDDLGFAELATHAFPGNVRELRNLIDRALALAPAGFPVDLGRYLHNGTDVVPVPKTLAEQPTAAGDHRSEAVRLSVVEALTGDRAFRDAKAMVIDAFERVFLATIVEKADGNLTKAAVSAQMDRKHLRELLKRHDLYDDDDSTAR